MTAAVAMADRVGVRAACTALAVARPTYYRHRRPACPARVRPRPPLALSAPEEQAVLDVLHSERFIDLSPTEVYATLLDDEVYHCSARTMYRVLARHDEVHERRASCATGGRRNRSCWPPPRTKCGRGTSPSCSAPRSGRTSTSTC